MSSPTTDDNLPRYEAASKEKLIASLKSDRCHEVKVEELSEADGTILRVMRFITGNDLDEYMWQSEVKIVLGENGAKETLDCVHLGFEVHQLFVCSLAMHKAFHEGTFYPPARKMRTLLLGMGPGAVFSFLKHILPEMDIDGVDIDPTVIEAGRRHFGLTEGPCPHGSHCKHCCRRRNPEDGGINVSENDDLKLQTPNPPSPSPSPSPCCCSCDETRPGRRGTTNIFVQDAVEFLRSAAAESYDFIIIDVDSKDPGVGSPPADFLTPEFFRDLRRVLRTDGVVAMNVLYVEDDVYETIEIESLGAFASMHAIGCEEEDGGVIFLLSVPGPMNGTIISRSLSSCPWNKHLAGVHHCVNEYFHTFFAQGP
eukprot:Rmarinus@m.15207